MGIPQCSSETNTSTTELSKADKRLARELALFDYKPDDAIVGFKAVCALRNRSPSSTLRDVKAGLLPPPINIGPNSIGWHVGVIRQRLKGGE